MFEGVVSRTLASLRIRRWYPAAGHAPILLWRAGLGPLIGLLFAIASTTGRRTGHVRHNLITYREVEGRTFLTGLYGRRSHWYRNLQADPRVTLQTAWRRRPMRARPLTEDAELVEAHRLFRRRSPIFLRLYLWALGIKDDPSALLADKDRTMFVELIGTDEPTPPPVRTDLLWIWPAGLLMWLSLRLARRAIAGARCIRAGTARCRRSGLPWSGPHSGSATARSHSRSPRTCPRGSS